PTRTDLLVPNDIRREFHGYDRAFHRYGNVLYAIFAPQKNLEDTRRAMFAFLDLLLEERDQLPLTKFRDDSESIKREWFEYLMPVPSRESIVELLKTRRYVILEGPPGTGKTRLAMQLLENEYRNNGRSILFHANTTYENFVGGLAPVSSVNDAG